MSPQGSAEETAAQSGIDAPADLPTERFAIVTTRCDCSRCTYCDQALSPRHEHDHFPVPKSLGGTDVVPVCLSCHDLKDRVPITKWPQEVFWEAFKDVLHGPPRILVAKVLTELLREYGRKDPAAFEHTKSVLLDRRAT